MLRACGLKTDRVMRRVMALTMVVAMLCTSVPVHAQGVSLPAVGVMVPLSETFTPVILRGMTVHPDKPLNFDFIIDEGDAKASGGSTSETQNVASLRPETSRLVNYFLAALTVPEGELWVNLSPFEKDRIITDGMSRTELGRDLLAQDYVLKQLTASLIYPEGDTGRAFWAKVYEEAAKKFGTADIPTDTFNKVWITPESASVYEKSGTVFITKAHMKVMLESDYLAATASNAVAIHESPLKGTTPEVIATDANVRARQAVPVQTEILRSIIVPAIEKEVNEGRNFALLRQVFYSLVLAQWYKKAFAGSAFRKAYADRNKMAGVDGSDPALKDTIYQQYLAAYKQGVFNYIKEENDQVTSEPLPRKYFSGGFSNAAMAFVAAEPADVQKVAIQSSLLNGRVVLNVPSSRQAKKGADLGGRPGPWSADPAMMAEYRTGEIRKIRSALGMMWEVFTKGHPSVLYHSIDHSLDAAVILGTMAEATGLSGSDQVLLRWAAALHDFDPDRSVNTPARVRNTLADLTEYQKNMLATGDARMRRLFSDGALLITQALIARTEFPFALQHPAYQDGITPVGQYRDLILKIQAMYGTDRARFVMRWAALLSEYADKGGTLLVYDFPGALKRIHALLDEVNTKAGKPVLEWEKFIGNNYSAFLSTVGAAENFDIDQRLAQEMGLGALDLPAVAEGKLPQGLFPAAMADRYARNRAAFKVFETVLQAGLQGGQTFSAAYDQAYAEGLKVSGDRAQRPALEGLSYAMALAAGAGMGLLVPTGDKGVPAIDLFLQQEAITVEVIESGRTSHQEVLLEISGTRDMAQSNDAGIRERIKRFWPVAVFLALSGLSLTETKPSPDPDRVLATGRDRGRHKAAVPVAAAGPVAPEVLEFSDEDLSQVPQKIEAAKQLLADPVRLERAKRLISQNTELKNDGGRITYSVDFDRLLEAEPAFEYIVFGIEESPDPGDWRTASRFTGKDAPSRYTQAVSSRDGGRGFFRVQMSVAPGNASDPAMAPPAAGVASASPLKQVQGGIDMNAIAVGREGDLIRTVADDAALTRMLEAAPGFEARIMSITPLADIQGLFDRKN